MNRKRLSFLTLTQSPIFGIKIPLPVHALSILLILLLSTNCFGQDNPQNLLYEFSNFSGGLNSKISEYSLPKNQCTIAENVRFNTKLNSLVKRKATITYGTADATETITGMHRVYLKDGTKTLLVTHGDEVEKGVDSTGAFNTILALTTGNYRWQRVTWNNIAIGTDGYNQPVKYDGFSASATYLGSALATDAGSGAGPNGTYHYKISFYTASYEVAFNVASNAVIVTDNDINLTMIPIAPTTYLGETVTGRKVYRHANGGSTYYLLSNGTIANNTAVTLTDSDADGGLSGTEYPTTYTCTPPKGKLALIHYNRLFLANDPNAPSRIYYSYDGSADYFLPTDYYMNIRPDDGDQITFILTWLGKLVWGKENSIGLFHTDGSNPSSDWEITDPYTKIGCKAMYTAKVTPIGIIYLGSDGLYKFTGHFSQLISDAVTPEIKDIAEPNISNCWSEYHKSIYYLAYTAKSVGGSANNRVLLYDLLSNAYSIDTISANSFCTFGSGTDWDVLYFGSSTDGKVYAYQAQAYEIMHGRQSDFGGTFTNARYIPTTAGGEADSPIIEIARVGVINDLSGTIDAQTGTIDRGSLTGSYISQALNVGASTYNKVYWNPSYVSSGDTITVAIRSAATEAGLTGAWSAEYSDPSGSDISALTANVWMQYRISLTTDAYTHSPILVKLSNYNLRLTYNKEGSTGETTVPFRWKSGWTDLGYYGYNKVLKKIYSNHTGTSGTLTLKISNLEGDSDTFEIDLANNPNQYSEYFTTGKFLGRFFNLEITNNDLNDLEINKIGLVFDVDPLI